MGDVSEIRGLVVVGSFLGMFALLGLAVPYFFAHPVDNRRIQAVPDYFEISEIQFVTESVNLSLSNPMLQDIIGIDGNTFGGHRLYIGSYAGQDSIYMCHYFLWAFWRSNTHHMAWYDDRGNDLSFNLDAPLGYSDHWALNISELDKGDYGTHYSVKCEHVEIIAVFGYNQSLYTTHLQAWDSGELKLWLGINFDQVKTSYNAWNIIGSVLFFQMPSVHWAINAMIAIPIWICIAYISFILILRAIGAVFGGGGA